MKLHIFPPSPNAKKAMMVNTHLNLGIEQKVIDLQAGEHKSPAFLSLNPNGRIPVLEFDDGSSLWESNVIINWLADSVNSEMFSRSEQIFQILKWQNWEAAHWTPACGKFISKHLFKNDSVDMEEATSNFSTFAAVLDAQLGANEWIAGNQMTNADLSVGAILCYREACQYPMDGYKNIQRWVDQLEQLPAWQTANQ